MLDKLMFGFFLPFMAPFALAFLALASVAIVVLAMIGKRKLDREYSYRGPVHGHG